METAREDVLFAKPFTWGQALEGGLSRSRLASLLRERRIRRVLHGVYAHHCLADSLETRMAALQLVMLPQVIVCGRTASWLWGVDAFRYAELEILPPLETCVQSQHNRTRRTGCRGARRALAPSDVVALEGLSVTTPLRTALDLGCELRRREALATLDGFLRLGHFNRAALVSDSRRFAGRRGVIQLRELVSLADGRAESPGESSTRLCLVDMGLPMPQLQFVVQYNGIELFRLDLAYPHHRVCVEYDGEEFHSSAEAREHDEARRAWLREHGWIVIVVRKSDLTSEGVMQWTTEVRVALESRHH